MNRWIFVRHGESQLNVRNRTERVYCGQYDTPLTARGRRQAVAAARTLSRWSGVRVTTAVSSPLARCRETLAVMLDELPYAVDWLPPDRRISERSLGAFEGLLEPVARRQYPRYFEDPALRGFDQHFSLRVPGGENLADVTERACEALAALSASAAGDILVVSHYTTIRCLLGRLRGLASDAIQQLQVPNAEPICVTRE